MLRIATCEVCGNQFPTHKKNAKTCSTECCRIRTAEQRKIKQQLAKEEKKKKEKAPKKLTLAEINNLARAAGMTYGKYKSLLYLEQQKQK